MSNKCEIKLDKIVKWTIYKKNIDTQLIGSLNKNKNILDYYI